MPPRPKPKTLYTAVEVCYDDNVRNLQDCTSGYAYSNDVEGLERGDIVRVPGPFWSPEYPQLATVVKLGSEYRGYMKPVLGLVRKGKT